MIARISKRTPYELAAKLAFSVSNSMPNEALLAAAAVGFTGAGNSLDEQAEGLLSSNEARTQYRRFFRHWVRDMSEPMPLLKA